MDSELLPSTDYPEADVQTKVVPRFQELAERFSPSNEDYPGLYATNFCTVGSKSTFASRASPVILGKLGEATGLLLWTVHESLLFSNDYINRTCNSERYFRSAVDRPVLRCCRVYGV